MNKAIVDQYLPTAYEAIKAAGIPNAKGQVNKSYRGQISTLGAAITMGSIKSAVCYFKERANNNTDVDRRKLLHAITYILQHDEETKKRYSGMKELPEYVMFLREEQIPGVREDIINAAIAIKLAMNLYEWEK